MPLPPSLKNFLVILCILSNQWSYASEIHWHTTKNGQPQSLKPHGSILYLQDHDLPARPHIAFFNKLQNLVPTSWYLQEAAPEEKVDLLNPNIQELRNVTPTQFGVYDNEVILKTDNDLYYFSPFRGRAFPSRARNDKHLFFFRSGFNNLIEIFVDGKLIASRRSTLFLSGELLPEKGSMLCVRTRSLGQDNLGLINVIGFPQFEQFSTSQNGPWKILKQKDFDKIQSQGPFFFKTFYTTSTPVQAPIYIRTRMPIESLKINGQLIEDHTLPLPKNLFQLGKNEVIYSLPYPQIGLNDNIKFTSVSRKTIKASIQAQTNSSLQLAVRGAIAQITINGIEAGRVTPLKDDTSAGLGLFKNGPNDIEITFLVYTPGAAITDCRILNSSEMAPNLIHWHELKEQIAPDFFSAFCGSFLSQRTALLKRINGNFYAQGDTSLILDFSRGHHPDYLWKQGQIDLPENISLNGHLIKIENSHAILPAAIIRKGRNIISLNSYKKNIPQPYIFPYKKSYQSLKIHKTKAPSIWPLSTSHSLELPKKPLFRSSSKNSMTPENTSWNFSANPLKNFGIFKVKNTPIKATSISWLAALRNSSDVSTLGLEYQKIFLNLATTQAPRTISLPKIQLDDPTLRNMPGLLTRFLIHLESRGKTVNWQLQDPEQIINEHGEDLWKKFIELRKEKILEEMHHNILNIFPNIQIEQ